MNSNLIIYFILTSFMIADRGDLVSTEILGTANSTNNQVYIDNELSALAGESFFNLTVEYGYRLYKIVYETIDANGNATHASGVVSYPRIGTFETPNEAYPILSYQHGTAIEKNSVTSATGIWVLPALIAGYGYVYMEPDYLGLGESDGLHPYHIKELYGSDIVDMLRAVKQFSDENDQFQINEQLFLAGYSEGGYATMATHQIIERDYTNEFNITSSFPMAGAYDMSGIMTDIMLDYTPYGEPFYFPYVLFSYCDNYQNTLDSVDNYLLPEYADILIDLFDGMHSGDEINSAMPNIPITIMKPDSINSFQSNLNHPLRIALQENDLYDWTPQSNMYIIHGEADELVPFENAEIAYNQFIQNNAQNVELVPIPENLGGHQSAAPFALLGAFQIAEEMKIINEIGDVNQDEEIDILDVVLIVEVIVSGSNSSYALWASDVNQDNNIDIMDIIILINTIISI